MDAGEVLRHARARAGLSQRDLAERARTSRSSLVAYEKGSCSPTVRQLNLLLAVCNVQLRPVIEPRVTEAEADADLALAGPDSTALLGLGSLARSLEECGVRWALDGASALAAYGLSVDGWPSVVIEDDDLPARELEHLGVPPFRRWIWRHGLQGVGRQGYTRAVAAHESHEDLRGICERAPLGNRVVFQLQTRLLRHLPPHHLRDVDGLSLPVLDLDEVAAGHPRWAGLLAELGRRGWQPSEKPAQTSPPGPVSGTHPRHTGPPPTESR